MKNILIELYNSNNVKELNNFKILGKDFFYNNSIRQILKFIRKEKYNKFFVGIFNTDFQIQLLAIKWLVFLSNANEKKIIDRLDNEIQINLLHIIKSSISFLIEIILSFLLIIKTKIIVKWIDRQKVKINYKNIKNETISYLRGDLLFGIKAGGSLGHIQGIIDGFKNLEYKIKFFSTENILTNSINTDIKIIKPQKWYQNIPEIPNIAYSFRMYKKVFKFLNKKKFSGIIYQRYSILNFCGLLLRKKLKAPLILEYNGSEVWVAKNWSKKMFLQKLAIKIEQINLELADIVVVVSKVLKEQLISRGIPEKKIVFYPNCVDLKKFNPDVYQNDLSIRKKYQIENKFIIGFIGTFGAWHGIEILAKSIKNIISSCDSNDIHFLIMGDGILKSKLLKIIKSDNVEKFVTLTGIIPQHQAPKYLAMCDILVSPHVPNPDGTKFFGSPTKLFEYMAMVKPIVASNLDQIGEILKDGKTALLSEPGNIDDFSNKVVKLINSPTLRKKLSINARLEVEKKYTWPIHVNKIIEKYSNEYL